MKTQKPRLAFVTGAQLPVHHIELFERLSNRFDVGIFTFDAIAVKALQPISIKLHLFQPLSDMPGYMRGLDESLKGYDVIIGYETSSLSSFQALRASQKNGVCFVVIADEYIENFYGSYANISAVQDEIIKSVDYLICTSGKSKANLIALGASKDKIMQITPVMPLGCFKTNDQLRRKFRSYIGVSDEEVLVGAVGPLEPGYNLESLIDGFARLHKTIYDGRHKAKLLLVGEGEYARVLKYRAYDQGIGSHVIFVEQDCRPFAHDLCSALDAFVSLPVEPAILTQHQLYPVDLVLAAGCETMAIVGANSLQHEISGDQAVLLLNNDPHTLAQALFSIVTNANERSVKRGHVALDVFGRFEVNNDAVSALEQQFSCLAKTRALVPKNDQSIKSRIEQIRSEVDAGRYESSISELKSCLRNKDLEASLRSDVLCLMGDVLRHQGLFSQAIDFYSDAIQHNEQNFYGYRGLGFAALQGHSHQEAITFFKKALSLNSEGCDVAFGMGLTYRRLNMFVEAMQWLEKSVMAIERDGRELSALIQTCLECTNATLALAVLERVSDSLEISRSSLILALGQLYLRVGKSELGHEMVEQALAMQALAGSNAA